MTIEERALEKYPIFINEYSDSCEEYDSSESDRLTYIEGATDQDPISREDERKKVIEKAVQFLEREYAYNGSGATIDPEFISAFEQAMEE